MLKQFFKISHLNNATIALLGMMVVGNVALAADLQPYSDVAFRGAQDANKTIVLDYHADWCPVCRKQLPAVNEALRSKGLENVVGFEVNFDNQPPTLKKDLKVTQQSTLIVFKGKAVTGRESGVTDSASIKRLIEGGL